ncbi:alcohol dehydrogenase superfamily protein [Mycena olivaceomarginata]|nr:alcohol dehydrogenase superfamily protein [Mycena olivaceomarginata]
MTIPATTRQYRYTEFGSYENLVLEEVKLSLPKGNEVLVKTHAVSLQYRELLIATERYPLPVVPCSDMAGEIIAIGEDVKQWKIGDRVAANFFLDKVNDVQTAETDQSALGGAIQGVLTEYRSYPSHSLVAVPPHLSYEEASTLPCAALTAYNALLCGFTPLKAGDTILVQGTGGVSIFALQFAVASGATVIATSSSDEKLKAAKDLGAAHVINYRTTPDWDREAIRLTGGLGVDRVIEVGGNATLARSIAAVKIGGSIDLIGIVGGPNEFGPVDVVLPVMMRGLKVRGIYVGSVPQFNDMLKLMIANPKTTRPVIDRVFPFEKSKEAFAYLQSQAHVGKVVIEF